MAETETVSNIIDIDQIDQVTNIIIFVKINEFIYIHN